MNPDLGMAIAGMSLLGGGVVAQKLASLKMAIRAEADSQKAVAIDAHIDESQLARKLQDKEALTIRDLDRFPEEVQRAWHLEELTRMGLPERVKRWLVIARELDARRKQSA